VARIKIKDARELRHDPTLGEVDPRSYPLLCRIRFACAKIGHHERLNQAKYLVHAADRICTQEGERNVRFHLTAEPGVDPKVAVEVRGQVLSSGDGVALAERFGKRLAELASAGEQGGWVVL